MLRRKNTVFVLLVLFLFLSAWSMPIEAEVGSLSEFDAQTLDAYISGQMSKHGIQGIALAVTSKTEIIYLKGYGTAGDGRPMTPQTPMHIGSQSKSFTGLAIAQLIEQGLVDVSEQPVERPKKAKNSTTVVKRSGIPKKHK